MQQFEIYQPQTFQLVQQQPQNKLKKAYGVIHATIFPALVFVLMVLLLVVVYLVAVKMHFINPFPNTSTISDAAEHYPNYLLWRCFGSQLSPMMFLVMLIQYYYIQGIYRKIQFDSPKYLNKLKCFLILSFIAPYLFDQSVAALDKVYQQSGMWVHVIGASGFFIIILFAFINLLKEMHKIRELTGEQFFSDCSYYTKLILVILNVCSDLIAILVKVLSLEKIKFKDESYVGVWMEWIGAFLILFVFGTMVWDFKKLNVQMLELKSNSNQDLVEDKEDTFIYGSFAASNIPSIAAFLCIFGIILTYVVSVALGHVQPFPNCYISDTAVQFPDYIFFRLFCISACPFIFGSILLEYYNLSTLYKKCTMYQQHACRAIPILGFLGSFAFSMSTSAIADDGTMNEKLHLLCAGSLFLLLQAAFCLIFYDMHKIRFITGSYFISDKCFYSKAILIPLQLVIFFFNFFGSKFKFMPDHYNVMIEWFATTVLIFQIITISWDLKNYNVGLCDRKETHHCCCFGSAQNQDVPQGVPVQQCQQPFQQPNYLVPVAYPQQFSQELQEKYIVYQPQTTPVPYLVNNQVYYQAQ